MKNQFTSYNPSPYSRGCLLNFAYYYCPPHTQAYLSIADDDQTPILLATEPEPEVEVEADIEMRDFAYESV
jgi:hypothetical protein